MCCECKIEVPKELLIINKKQKKKKYQLCHRPLLNFNGTGEKVVTVKLDFVWDGPDPAGCSTMFGGEAIDKEHYTEKNPQTIAILQHEIIKENCSCILKIISHIYSFHICAISEQTFSPTSFVFSFRLFL